MGGKISNAELRKKVFELCDRLGFWNVRPVETAKQLGTAHQNVSRWKQQYIEKYGIPDIQKVGKELNVNSQTALKELILIMKSGKSNHKVQAAKAYFESVEKFTKFLESFGYKEKIAEKLDLSGSMSLHEEFAKRYEEVMNEGTKSEKNHSPP
jgi:hypothetical protein